MSNDKNRAQTELDAKPVDEVSRRRYDAAGSRFDRVGLRTWAIGLLAAFSVANPGSFTRYGVFVALVVWLTGRPGKFQVDRIFWVTTLMISWFAVTTYWAINPNAFGLVRTSAVIAIIFLLSRDAVRTLPQLRVVAIGYVLASFVASIRLLMDNISLNVDIQRQTLGELNANYLGYAFTGALAVVVLLWATSPNRRLRWILLVAAAGILLGLQLTGTRGAAVGAALLATWLLLCRVSKRPPLIALLACISVISIVITTGVLDGWLRIFDFGSRATGDISGRLTLWPAAKTLWAEHWLIGSGPGAMRASNPLGIDAHSVFLEIGSAQGIIGVSLLVLFFVTTLAHDTRSAPSHFRARMIGAFLTSMAPAYLSGAWELAPAAWVLLLIFSRIGVVTESRELRLQNQHLSLRPSRQLRYGGTHRNRQDRSTPRR